MRQNSVMPMVEIVQETDRYIADPGQALAYMVGRLEIQRIRADAERDGSATGSTSARSTTRCWAPGPLPLTVLEDVVRSWAAPR